MDRPTTEPDQPVPQEPPASQARSVPQEAHHSWGLDPDRERDACGIGFIAHIEGKKQRRILDMALEALANLAHRGASAADGKTSDGTGVLTQIPWQLLRADRCLQQLRGTASKDLALGCFFLPAAHTPEHHAAKRLIEEVAVESGSEDLFWRPVPTVPTVLGDQARDTCPSVWHAVLTRPRAIHRGDAFERRLYLMLRRIENRALEQGLDHLVVVSLSHRTTVYKSMARAVDLPLFYPDLAAPPFKTAVAVFHQRFSTNTQPSWRLAQPFRLLAHNGEINTIEGNYNWMRAREPELASPRWGDQLPELLPVLDRRGSDSAMLDQMLEFLTLSGRDPLHSLAMLMPEANRETSDDPALQNFFDFHATLLEPWDGPAAVVASDGRLAVAALDRNGLRPQRYWRTSDGLVILGSEAGMVAVDGSTVVDRGRLGPGQMLAVDMVHGEVLDNHRIKSRLAQRRDYGRWLEEQMLVPPEATVPDAFDQWPEAQRNPDELVNVQKAFGYSVEAVEKIIDGMATRGKPPVASMGNDAPLAVLSEKPQLLYTYFKQRFAQVTNPPVDPLRERLVFDLDTVVGGWSNLLAEAPQAAHLIRFHTPILTTPQFRWLSTIDSIEDSAFRTRTLDARWRVAEDIDGLRTRVEALMLEAEAAADDGVSLLILSDRGVDGEHAPVPMLLATAAVHHHLVRVQKRMRVSIVCDTGEPREDHHFACLIAYGATLVHPYLVYETLATRSEDLGLPSGQAVANYLRALEQGLLKAMSRLGVAPMASYHGAQLFEALGIDQDVIDRYFTGTPSRVSGVGLKVLASDVLDLHVEAFGHNDALLDRGFFRFRRGGEHHELNPKVFKALHKAVRKQDTDAFEQYSQQIDTGQPTRLRDLLAWRRADEPLPLDAVESAESIAERFCSAAMSLGALSREAHEVLAIGMNRLGARSNSGEGGEAVRRFKPYDDDNRPDFLGKWKPQAGDWGGSAIKQVASGRFGVTPEYLTSARELEIKMAQGSKPGEGGQIPGHKVTEEIAGLRRSVPGVALISPPPHHDIYSIEDLAQLIHDLHRVNGEARVGVKLVSLAGVGTVAAGVVKAGADYVLISGDDGGTGASPLSSIKHAGMPWELGLAETQRRLVENGLRERVSLRVDGGLKTGRDVVLAALLGAEEFAFGTAPLVAIGCVMARQCHLDTCPVGIATQREDLRQKFPGTPENVVAFMLFVAEQVRHILAQMGFRKLDDIVGRLDLIESREDRAPVQGLDLARLLQDPDPENTRPRRRVWERNLHPEGTLDDRLRGDVSSLLGDGSLLGDDSTVTSTDEPALSDPALSYTVNNRDRSIGARLSGHLAKGRLEGTLPNDTDLRVDFHGAAGQSFGIFLVPGVELRLWGEAQDGVGKGLAGGRLVIRPPQDATPPTEGAHQTLAGNTVLYGATDGELFVAGQVGERFCVRSSGAEAVVEGCGDHGCEYMTAGTAVVLGNTGRNFGAGMSGGLAFVFDPEGTIQQRLNTDSVDAESITDPDELEDLHRLLTRHVELTGSPKAQDILGRWPASVEHFVRVAPLGTHPEPSLEKRPVEGVEPRMAPETGVNRAAAVH